ncbi:MAG: cytochrome c biogenesis protein ResB [Thermoleophilia bacterium]
MSADKAAIVQNPEKLPGKNVSIGRRISHFLVSMKLAVTLLFVIALVSIIGTILPQGETVYNSGYVKNPLFDFYKTLGLFDMYGSWWFLSILALLISNMSFCITKRLPTTWKHLRRPRVDVKDVFITHQPFNSSIPGAGEAGLRAGVKLLSGHHFRLHTGPGGSVMAEKGRFSPLASICFHLSFILIALGALLGTFFGFKESLEIPDGKTATDPITQMQVRNNGFQVKYQEVPEENGRGSMLRPSVYSSDLEVFENGELVGSKVIEVNAPLRIKTHFYDVLNLEGINFHQSSYYQTSRGYVTVLEVNHKPGKTIIYLGFIMMMAGITFALYFPHRRLWLKVGEQGELLVGARTNRSRISFQKEFDRLVSELRLTLGQEGTINGLG